MDNIKNVVVGGIITMVIGGTAYTFSQEAVVNNLASDIGISQEKAEEYVNSIPEEDFATWTEIGSGHVSSSVETLAIAEDIDCENYEYEWETPLLTCSQGRAQLQKIGKSEELLGNAYIKLDSENASEADISSAIRYIDQLSADYQQPISVSFDIEIINEVKMTNSYNKSVLNAALESSKN